MWAEYRNSAVLLPASSAVRPSVLSTCTTSDILSTPSPPRSIGHCSGRGRPLPRVLNDVDCLERAPLAPLIRMSNLAMMCYINSHWQKSQVCLFCCCCTDDFCLQIIWTKISWTTTGKSTKLRLLPVTAHCHPASNLLLMALLRPGRYAAMPDVASSLSAEVNVTKTRPLTLGLGDWQFLQLS